MSDEKNVISHIRGNAELVVTIASKQLGKEVGYNENGVEWLDGYIQRQHIQGDVANRDGLVNTLGAYLGECIIHNFGGEWSKIGDNWCIKFDERNAAYPFAKVAKQLKFGAEDSVLSFFTAIPILFQLKAISPNPSFKRDWLKPAP